MVCYTNEHTICLYKHVIKISYNFYILFTRCNFSFTTNRMLKSYHVTSLLVSYISFSFCVCWCFGMIRLYCNWCLKHEEDLEFITRNALFTFSTMEVPFNLTFVSLFQKCLPWNSYIQFWELIRWKCFYVNTLELQLPLWTRFSDFPLCYNMPDKFSNNISINNLNFELATVYNLLYVWRNEWVNLLIKWMNEWMSYGPLWNLLLILAVLSFSRLCSV